MFLPRIFGCVLVAGLALAAGLSTYTDKLKQAAKTEAELVTETREAEQDAAQSARAAEEAAKRAEQDKKEREEQLARRLRWNTLVVGLVVFVLAVFVGFEVISKVPTTLHTPLMSGSNAISGITVVGAITLAGFGVGGTLSQSCGSIIGMVAVSLAMINVVGGFLVTHRMLAMFKRR